MTTAWAAIEQDHLLASAGDNHTVEIGHNTNLQDGVSVGTLNPSGHSTKVGSGVSVGHGAVLHGCTVEDNVLIGMNAVLQDGVKVRGGLSESLLEALHCCRL